MTLRTKANSHTGLRLRLRPVHNHNDSVRQSNLCRPTSGRVTKSTRRLGGRRFNTGPPKL